MNRNLFIKKFGIAGTGFLLAPNTIFSQDDKPAAYQKSVVQEFVGAAHSNIDKVKELLNEYPNLVYSSHDWGGGDFEMAIEAGGHVGHKEMVNYLIEMGARPTLHALTMLGKTDIVMSYFKAFPSVIKTLGPHGFTFYHHAQKGGEDAKELQAYFESINITETKIKLY
jgi:hypothetical protein